jgi:peptidoglycan/xylan/chitin deacetylase (PgdA/CDA1 family)
LIEGMTRRAINITFHGVGPTERTLEPGEDRVWVSHEQFVAVLDAIAGRDDVHITFDDGNASDVDLALPALSRRGLRASFFVVAGRIGSPGFLDAHGIRALAAAGMGIGSHGMRHRRWLRLDAPALQEETAEAKRVLEDIVERPVTAAACPFGAYDRRSLRVLRERGFRTVYTSDRGTASKSAWLQPRNSVGPADGADVLDRILAAEKSRPAALRRRAKLTIKRWR